MWRAIRYGLDGELLDLDARRALPGRARRSSGCCAWTAPVRAELGIEVALPRGATAPSASGAARLPA